MIKAAIHKCFRVFGLDVVKFPREEQPFPPDFGAEEIGTFREVRPWTMTSPERIYALIQAVRYISSNRIAGAVVECGVWKGGSMAAVAKTLLQFQDVSRDLFLFDTFEGMTDPAANDFEYTGKHANQVLSEEIGSRCSDAPLKLVKEVMVSTGYPRQKMHFVRGRVEKTIPAFAPDNISLLRLDTDWYESTKHELTHLFPRLSRSGVIIIDDYGHWKGSRKACDEYFADQHVPILLSRIDYTGRIAVKQ